MVHYEKCLYDFFLKIWTIGSRCHLYICHDLKQIVDNGRGQTLTDPDGSL